MPRWLVTGGAGFIGSQFIRMALTERSDLEIVNLDVLTYAGNRDTLRELDETKRHRWIQGDIIDPKVIMKAMEGVSCVIHFAAESHVDRSIEDASCFIRTNVIGSFHLLEAAKRCGIERFIYISTDEVYGPTHAEHATETSPMAPTNPYSASKSGADLLAQSYFKTHGLPVIVTRASNNYGPYQYPEKLIPLLITRAIEGQYLPLYGDGAYTRDWLFVEDNTRAILKLIVAGTPGEIYNIAGDNEWKNIDVAKLILKYLRKKNELIRFVKDRPAHDRRYAMKCDKLKALGWKTTMDFESGLKVTVDWYVANPQWWRKLKRHKSMVS